MQNQISSDPPSSDPSFDQVDEEAVNIGLQGSGLDAAREQLEQVSPGFTASRDSNADFLKEALGVPPRGGEGSTLPSTPQQQAARLKAAADYLAAKSGGSESKGKNKSSADEGRGTERKAAQLRAAAATLRSKSGATSGQRRVASTLISMKRKREAAAKYLAAKRKAEAAGEEGEKS